MAKTNTMIISGSGQFPVDMLRYERAYPASENDSYAIAETFNGKSSVWSIHVTKTTNAPWTVERWHSFGVRIQRW